MSQNDAVIRLGVGRFTGPNGSFNNMVRVVDLERTKAENTTWKFSQDSVQKVLGYSKSNLTVVDGFRIAYHESKEWSVLHCRGQTIRSGFSAHTSEAVVILSTTAPDCEIRMELPTNISQALSTALIFSGRGWVVTEEEATILGVLARNLDADIFFDPSSGRDSEGVGIFTYRENLPALTARPTFMERENAGTVIMPSNRRKRRIRARR